MLEFALLAPVVAAFIAGLVGVSMTFVRTMQSDLICRKAAQMAAAGADLDQPAVRDEIYGLYGGKALRDHTGVLYVSQIVRDEAGYRRAKTFELGRVNRWSSAAGTPDSVISLETGEHAWVAELWFDNDSIFSSLTPKELHARSIR